MTKILSKDDLWNLTNSQILKLIKGKHVRIVFNDRSQEDVYIKNLGLACNNPHLYTDLIKKDDSQIPIDKIEHIEIINT